MTDLLTITSGALTAAINPFGAELTHLADAAGRALMTDADPAHWAKHAPVLFPVIGITNGGVIRVDGTAYPMPKHGFARDHLFDIVRHEADALVLRLAASADTRAHYPFDFVLEMHFRVEGARLTLEAQVANTGDRAMPAQFGFHPALAWPLPFGAAREEHRVTFDADEPGSLRRIQPDGLIDPAPRASPLDGGRVLHLADALFTDDALVWDPVVSQGVTYGAPGTPQLRVEFPDTPALGIWTQPGAHFVCIEPWHGIADPAGFSGELADKPGVFLVPPGATKRIAMSIALEG